MENLIKVKDKLLFDEPLVTNGIVYNLPRAVKASKYPMAVDVSKTNYEITTRVVSLGNAVSGSGHDNFLKGVLVTFDLTWSVKASVELQRYHFIDFISSQSTMHRISKFELDKQYIKYVDEEIVKRMNELRDDYLNESDNELKKEKYLTLLYSNPCGFRLTAQMTTNYLQLKTIYNQRKNHRLPEWQVFCEWVEDLPMFKEFCLK